MTKGKIAGLILFVAAVLLVNLCIGCEIIETCRRDPFSELEIRPIYNRAGTEVVGEYALLRLTSADCDERMLTDWYFQIVHPNNYYYCMIIYTDYDEPYGCYAYPGLVETDVPLHLDGQGEYSHGKEYGKKMYIPDSDCKKLIEFKTDN